MVFLRPLGHFADECITEGLLPWLLRAPPDRSRELRPPVGCQSRVSRDHLRVALPLPSWQSRLRPWAWEALGWRRCGLHRSDDRPGVREHPGAVSVHLLVRARRPETIFPRRPGTTHRTDPTTTAAGRTQTFRHHQPSHRRRRPSSRHRRSPLISWPR